MICVAGFWSWACEKVLRIEGNWLSMSASWCDWFMVIQRNEMIVYGWYCSLKLELAWLERQCGCGWWFSVRFYWWCIGCVTNRERKRFVYSIHSWFPFFCSLLIQWVLVVMSTDIAVYLRPANQTIVSGSTSFTAQSEAALSLPEGVWVAGVLAIIALILQAVFLIFKGKKVRGHGVPSVCVE